MSYFELWKKRHTKNGNNAVEQLRSNSEKYAVDHFKDCLTYQKGKIWNTDIDVDIRVTSSDILTKKLFYFVPNFKIKLGTMITLDENIWIAVEVDDDALMPRAKMWLCNTTLNFREGNDIVKIPIWAENQTMYNIGIVKREALDMYYGDTLVKGVINSELAKKYLYRDMRFLIESNGKATAYVTTYLDSLQKGIVSFQSSETLLVVEDDVENYIAYNRPQAIETGDYFIDGKDVVNFNDSETSYQLITNAREDIEYKFEVDDNSIAEIITTNKTSCILKPIKSKEYVVIKAMNENNDVVATKEVLIRG